MLQIADGDYLGLFKCTLTSESSMSVDIVVSYMFIIESKTAY